ncbi:type VI secretion system protein TssA [uncultured Massilia sp.]|uniref:type VI secretion system protein TssA n=1 Tax=uncultured Massilia sp. TaxID=169973 RepID=UPI0025FE9B4C|nr:type VI secretion system protein TssA [uncultured Massilia sp.]
MTGFHFSPPIALLSDQQLDELDGLVKPLREDAPSGPPIRFDPIFTEIRLAREEDDPNLPMGVWERPLKKADWPLIEARCKATLARHAKDLQIAAWLAEAWTRQSGLEGLFRGLVLVERLLARFWETLHPQLDDDGDAELRVAPLEWMNVSLSATLRVHVPVLGRGAGPAGRFTLADWERMTTNELSPARQEEARKAAGETGEVLQTRADIIAFVLAEPRAGVERTTQLVRGCLAAVLSIASFTDARLGMEAPTMSKLRDTLRAMERVLLQMTPPDRADAADAPAPPVAEGVAPAVAAPQVVASGWSSREEAYATLEAIADYLSRIEPHSPTPYLLRRAVNWGRMPLPELMAEIVREEGDLNRLGHLLGLNG